MGVAAAASLSNHRLPNREEKKGSTECCFVIIGMGKVAKNVMDFFRAKAASGRATDLYNPEVCLAKACKAGKRSL